MTMQESLWGLRAGTVGRQLHDKTYFLDLLGDSHNGLGHPEAAIEAYRQAAEGFRAQGAQCSYALCLFKIADSHLALGEPWHAVGYLEACLPLLRDLGMTRHETLAQEQLDACQAELAGAHLLGEGRADQRPLAARSRPAPRPDGRSRPGRPERCRCIHATRVDSCYARDRRTAALAEP
jgi:tetratricopeptide (TPR) repeat protein